MDHRRLDGALDNKALGILDDTLDADSAPHDERAAFGRVAPRREDADGCSGRTGAVGVAGVVGAEENGGRDMFSASLVGSGAERRNTKAVNPTAVGSDFGDEARKSNWIVLPVRPPARRQTTVSGLAIEAEEARRVCDV